MKAETPGSALIGRVAELDLVRTFVSDAAENGTALLLSGEAGVGKTVLLDAAAEIADAAGMLVLRTAGVECPTDLGYSALGRALQPLHHLVERLDAAQHDALIAMGSGTVSAVDRLLAFHAVLALLRAAGADRPVLLVVDDLQRIAGASALAFAFAARRLAGSHVGFLAAQRPGAAGVFERSGLPEYEVTPLDEQAAARLLGTRFPKLAPRVARRLLAEAQGNPLALVELPLALSEPQRSALRPLPTVLSLSRGLRAPYAARVADLPEPTRWPLLLAAVEGTGDLAAVAALAGGHGLDALAPAERAGLVLVDRLAGRLVFRHPLVRSTIVDRATSTDRRRAHHALAELLVHQPARRASHLADAATGPDERIADLVERSARLALAAGDAVGAVGALLRAADLSPTGPGRGRRLAEAAYVGAAVTGDLRSVPPLLAEARRTDPADHGSLPAVVAAAWLLLHDDGDVVAAHRLLVEAIPGVEGPDVKGPDVKGPDVKGADTVLDEAMHVAFEVCLCGGRTELWQSVQAMRVLVGNVSPDLELLSAFLCDPARVSSADVERLDIAVRGLHAEVDPTRIVRVGMAALAVDRGSDCRAALSRVVASGRDGGALTSAMSALTLLCVDDFLTGRWDECAHLAEEGAGMCAAHGYRLLAAPLRLVQALLAAARGNYATTLALTCEVNEWAVPRGNRTLGWAVHHALTLGALADGDAERAYHHASAISPAGTLAPHNAPALWVAMDLVEAAGRTGRVGEAVRHARAMRQAPLAAVSPRFAMLAAASAAMAASPDETAADLFEEALATVGGERWAFDHARVRLAYGEHLRRCRDTGSARRHLGAALATFRRLSADPWTARARDELRATGLTTDATRAAPGHHQPPSLTPEEREVTTFAASGLTNKQIAHRLHLSHHTVAARLYQVFPKLGVTSRAGLRDALAELSAAYDGVGP